MHTPIRSPIEPLEPRRLMADFTLDVDRDQSPVTITATLDGERLDTPHESRAFLDGVADVSLTRRGIQFSDADGNAFNGGDVFGGDVFGRGIAIVDGEGRRETFTFDDDDGQGVSVSGVSFAFDSGRINVSSKDRFSTRRITATATDGDLGATGVPLPGDLTGTAAPLDGSTGRVRRSSSSVRVTMPLEFTLSQRVTRFNGSQRLDVTFSGTLVGVGRASPVFGTLPVQPGFGTVRPGFGPLAETAKRDRVATNVLG